MQTLVRTAGFHGLPGSRKRIDDSSAEPENLGQSQLLPLRGYTIETEALASVKRGGSLASHLFVHRADALRALGRVLQHRQMSHKLCFKYG